MQHHVGPARCFADRGVVERVDLADLRPAQRMRGPARAYKADDSPAGVPERARRCITEPPAGAENEHARAHQAGSSNGLTSIGVLRTPTMSEFLSYALVPIAIAAVAVVLVLGLANMMRGGSPHTSQKLMRLRVLLQFVAIVVIMLVIWAIRG